MSALSRIVYATHANGAHHKLALDALRAMSHRDRKEWARVFLKHAELYLEGSQASDISDTDVKDYVLHVSDDSWGGAPEKVEAWYGQTVAELQAGHWPEAAYAAGVLSHYYTDPVMPFHTGQTTAENPVHRATAWSINRSYNALRAIGEERFADLDMHVPTGPNWLKEFVCDGAEFSHRHYETLLAHYDIRKGSTRPEEGLDDVAKGIVAELLMYAAKGNGCVLDAAITEARVAVPDVGLATKTFVAMTQIPQKLIEKRLTDAEDRKLVAAIYDELKTAEHGERASAKQTPPAIPTGAVTTATADTTALELAVAKSSHIASEATQPPPIPVRQAEAVQNKNGKYLFATDDLKAAPSIHPKMVERFAAVGVHTVGDFLGSDPLALAERLDDLHFDTETLAEWQDQAQMVIDVPGLRGTHAQLLVGAGYRTAVSVAEADPVLLAADVLKFAATSMGRRALREGRPPDTEKIQGWVEYAKQAVGT